MSIEVLIAKIINIKNSTNKNYEELGIFYFSDENIDEKFFEWLKSKDEELYLTVKSNVEPDRDNPTIYDFVNLDDLYDDEELLEIFINFISIDNILLDELEDNIKEIEESDYSNYDDYNDDYDDYSKEDRYDDYDYYDDDNYN